MKKYKKLVLALPLIGMSLYAGSTQPVQAATTPLTGDYLIFGHELDLGVYKDASTGNKHMSFWLDSWTSDITIDPATKNFAGYTGTTSREVETGLMQGMGWVWVESIYIDDYTYQPEESLSGPLAESYGNLSIHNLTDTEMDDGELEISTFTLAMVTTPNGEFSISSKGLELERNYIDHWIDGENSGTNIRDESSHERLTMLQVPSDALTNSDLNGRYIIFGKEGGIGFIGDNVARVESESYFLEVEFNGDGTCTVPKTKSNEISEVITGSTGIKDIYHSNDYIYSADGVSNANLGDDWWITSCSYSITDTNLLMLQVNDIDSDNVPDSSTWEIRLATGGHYGKSDSRDVLTPEMVASTLLMKMNTAPNDILTDRTYLVSEAEVESNAFDPANPTPPEIITANGGNRFALTFSAAGACTITDNFFNTYITTQTGDLILAEDPNNGSVVSNCTYAASTDPKVVTITFEDETVLYARFSEDMQVIKLGTLTYQINNEDPNGYGMERELDSYKKISAAGVQYTGADVAAATTAWLDPQHWLERIEYDYYNVLKNNSTPYGTEVSCGLDAPAFNATPVDMMVQPQHGDLIDGGVRVLTLEEESDECQTNSGTQEARVQLYQPDTDYVGLDEIMWKEDGVVYFDEITISAAITGEAYTVTSGDSVKWEWLSNCTDTAPTFDETIAEFVIVTSPQHGTLTDGGTETMTVQNMLDDCPGYDTNWPFPKRIINYTAAADYVGQDSILTFEPDGAFVLDTFEITAAGGTKGDFTGDGTVDLLLMHTTGALAVWGDYDPATGDKGASFSAAGGIPENWVIAARADFTGTGKEDLLLEHTTGALAVWGDYDPTTGDRGASFSAGAIPANWVIEHVADFTGDGKADILLKHTTGALAVWGDYDPATGVRGASFSAGYIPANWIIEHIADFTGNGTADFLLKHTTDALAVWGDYDPATGIRGAAFSAGYIPANWIIEHIADFTGNGTPDLLLKHTTDALAVWGDFDPTTGVRGAAFSAGAIPPNWIIEHIADFTSNGTVDILLKHTTDALAVWGDFDPATGVRGAAFSAGYIPPNWIIEQIADFTGNRTPDFLLKHTTDALAVWGDYDPATGIRGAAFSAGAIPPNWQHLLTP